MEHDTLEFDGDDLRFSSLFPIYIFERLGIFQIKDLNMITIPLILSFTQSLIPQSLTF